MGGSLWLMVRLGYWLPVGGIESLCGERHAVAMILCGKD
jgi:hypothetical protein